MSFEHDRHVIRLGDRIVWFRGQLEHCGRVTAISLRSFPWVGGDGVVGSDVPEVLYYQARTGYATFDVQGESTVPGQRGPTWCYGSEIDIEKTVRLCRRMTV